MNIIISGANFANKGAEAMLRTVQLELINRIPGVAFYLWHIREPYWQSATSSGFIPILLPIYRGRQCSWREMIGRNPFLWSLWEIARSRHVGRLSALFRRSDLLAGACRSYLDRMTGGIDAWLDISGFAYGDAWGRAAFQNVYPLWDYCRRNGRPMIFLPQAWGSFEKSDVQREILRLLGAPRTSFYSRDETSSRFLGKALQKPPGEIQISPDIAFRFLGGGVTRGRDILRKMGCMAERPIIGVAPNMRVYERMPGQGMANLYLKTLVKWIAHCMEKHDVDVVLIASEIELRAGLDDRYLCSQIAASLNRPDRCFMTREPLSAESTKALIGGFEILIGSRFHPFVFGFSQGIPGVAISWSHKYRELFSQFELGEYVLECRESESGELIEKFEKVWAEREKLKSVILSRTGRFQEEVRALFNDIAAKLNEN